MGMHALFLLFSSCFAHLFRRRLLLNANQHPAHLELVIGSYSDHLQIDAASEASTPLSCAMTSHPLLL
jgi:hypothetical protein